MPGVRACAVALGLISIHCLGHAPTLPAQTAVPGQQLTSPAQLADKKAASASTTASAPMDGSALVEAGLLYRRGDLKAAIGKYAEFLEQNPRSPDAYAGMIRAYIKLKNLEQAAQTLEKGLGQTDSPRLRVARGEVWFRQGRIFDAEKEWVEIINSGYPEARAYLGLSRVRNAIANYKSARHMIDKAHQLDIHDPDIEEAWIETLTLTERIKYLQDSLADENHWSSAEGEM